MNLTTTDTLILLNKLKEDLKNTQLSKAVVEYLSYTYGAMVSQIRIVDITIEGNEFTYCLVSPLDNKWERTVYVKVPVEYDIKHESEILDYLDAAYKNENIVETSLYTENHDGI